MCVRAMSVGLSALAVICDVLLRLRSVAEIVLRVHSVLGLGRAASIGAQLRSARGTQRLSFHVNVASERRGRFPDAQAAHVLVRFIAQQVVRADADNYCAFT